MSKTSGKDSVGHCAEDMVRSSTEEGYNGSPEWFHSEKGLSKVGYIPGQSWSELNHLPMFIVSDSDCLEQCKRDKSGFRYASVDSEESPMMQNCIEELFRLTHQRPILGRTKAIGLHFARGILAEKKGYAVNWAEFASRIARRAKKKGQVLSNKPIVETNWTPKRRAWVFDREKGSAVYELETTADDWELNRVIPRDSNIPEPDSFDLRSTLSKYPTQTVGRPLYRKRVFESVLGQNMIVRIQIYYSNSCNSRNTHQAPRISLRGTKRMILYTRNVERS
ncbi:hypothetical protein KC19_VG132700 [Ceratodon purpureus]|uniref:Uncharacterized protein n=1 Tax=Ceratodon purpureus TaxID=3225 RepID=A0A8T0HPS0_CERPU|nr:hypothetical protein KC19_VG132700 [Ceratodon purpureus]